MKTDNSVQLDSANLESKYEETTFSLTGRQAILYLAVKKGKKNLLHDATISKNIIVLKELIAFGVNINEKNANGDTALHVAARDNNSEVVKILAEQGANLNEKDNRGKTALHIAARHNYLEIISILTNLGANLESKDNGGLTPIMVAIQCNANQALKDLESRLPNPNAEAYAQRFDLFSIFGGQKISDALSAINKDEKHDGGFAQRSFSILARELEMFRNQVPVNIVEKYDRIIETYKNFEEAENYSAEKIRTAIKSGEKILLRTGYVGHYITALLEQNSQGDIQLVLIDRGATSKTKDNSDKVNGIRQISIPNDKLGLALDFLNQAKYLGEEPACELLFHELPKQMGTQFNFIPEIAHKPFKEGICFFANPKTAIDYLFRKEFGDSLGSTLYKNFTFSMRERQLSSYLNYANSHSLDKNAHNSLREKGRAILSQKADKLCSKIYDALKRNDTYPLSIFVKRNDELSNEVLFRLLRHASCQGNLAALDIICRQGADVNKKTADGTTALHNAKAEAAAVLCAKGVDVNARDSLGSTALDYAIMDFDVDKVKILLENKTSFDKDLIDDAPEEIKELLKQAIDSQEKMPTIRT
jgi:ankyrin repeat protein